MAPAAVDVEFRRHARTLEAQIHLGQTFADVLPVVVGAGEEGRRRIRRGLDVARAARIDEAEKVRPRTRSLDRIRRVLFASIKARTGEPDEFASGGKPQRADTFGINTPFLGTAADQADGTLRIGETMDVNRVGLVGFAGEAIFEHKGGGAVLAEFLSRGIAFVIHPQLPMPSTRNDEHRCTVGFAS